jgi:signal peptidase I
MTAGPNIMDIEMTTSPQTTPQEPGPAAKPAGRSTLGLVGKILGWLAMIVAGLVVVGLVSITIGPRFLPYQALIVRSGSMSPTIPTGSIVFYTKIPAGKVKVGDVIVFSKPGDPSEKVTHRVYKIGQSATGPYFITKGDANASPDDWRIPAAGTGWLARAHLPSVGYALVWMQSTIARLLLLVIPAILLGAITLYEIWQERGKGKTA